MTPAKKNTKKNANTTITMIGMMIPSDGRSARRRLVRRMRSFRNRSGTGSCASELVLRLGAQHEWAAFVPTPP